MKGQKTCQKCNTKTGPRTKVCKKCGHHFAFKFRGRRVKTNEIKDWRCLKRGDIIKSVQGYGPYWINEDGEREFCGNYGLFRVRYIEKDGIGAYPYGTKQRNGGFHFLYMGKQKTSITGGVSRSHKLEMVRE
tara:strand:- start:1655 stop:2050 length:396 start_codon:yes stop_codon:yes gene_type:complete